VKRPRSTPKLAELVGGALAPAMQRHGFATSELIARWADIAGPRFAAVTRPLRVTWPRRPEDAAGDAPATRGTLVVLCEGAHALDLQHEAPVLLERANVLYGWRAVERLAIRQGPVARRGIESRRPEPPPSPPMAEAVRAVADDDLRRALDRLGREVAAERRLTKP
jgi:hypothetical protein